MEPRPILANDFHAQWNELRSDYLATFECVGASGWYILGKEVAAFETALASWWGIDHTAGVASGLDAIEIGLRVLGCRPGDKVLTTAVSAFATSLAILRLGATPVFADCDERGLISLDECDAILAADPTIRYFVPVHLYGHSLDLDRLASLRDSYDLKIVEDCAQSIGAKWNGRATGTVGQIAATSFYPTKNLGTLGDGGALLTNDPHLAATARQLRDYGQSAKYVHSTIGYNSRLDELQAALLHRVLLPRLAGWIERRRSIAALYGIAAEPAESQSAWHLYPVFTSDKASLLRHLREQGIGAGEHYPIAIPDQPAIADRVWPDLPNARRICATEVSLPIHPYLSDDDVLRVREAFETWRARC